MESALQNEYNFDNIPSFWGNMRPTSRNRSPLDASFFQTDDYSSPLNNSVNNPRHASKPRSSGPYTPSAILQNGTDMIAFLRTATALDLVNAGNDAYLAVRQQNDDLKQHAGFQKETITRLEASNEELRKMTASLVNRVPDASTATPGLKSVEKPAPLQSKDYPNVHGWTLSSWKKYEGSKPSGETPGDTETALAQKPKRKAGRPTNEQRAEDSGTKHLYLEDENGNPLAQERLDDMTNATFGIFKALHHANLEPPSWGKVVPNALYYAEARLEFEFLEFRLCDKSWKAGRWLTHHYQTYARTYLKDDPRRKKRSKKPTSSDVPAKRRRESSEDDPINELDADSMLVFEDEPPSSISDNAHTSCASSLPSTAPSTTISSASSVSAPLATTLSSFSPEAPTPTTASSSSNGLAQPTSTHPTPAPTAAPVPSVLDNVFAGIDQEPAAQPVPLPIASDIETAVAASKTRMSSKKDTSPVVAGKRLTRRTALIRHWQALDPENISTGDFKLWEAALGKAAGDSIYQDARTEAATNTEAAKKTSASATGTRSTRQKK